MRSIVLLGCLAVLEPSLARADPPDCAELSETEVSARLRRLVTDIDREEPAMRRWWTSFLFLHGVMASATAILAGAADTSMFRDTMLASSISSTLGLLTLTTLTPSLVGAGGSLAAMSESSPEERLAKLRVAESVLRGSASQTGFVRGWLAVSATGLYTIGASATLIALGLTSGAYLHAIGGSIIGLGRILLHPTGGQDAWQRYEARHPACTAAPVPSDVSFTIVPAGAGLGFLMRF